MATTATIAAALSQQEGGFKPAVIDTAAPRTAAAAEAGCLEATRAAEGDTAAPRTAAAAEAGCLEATRTAAVDTAAARTAAEAECLEATRTAEGDTAAAQATAASTATAAAAAPRSLNTQTASEAINSTLMGIALLAYLQGSPAKHETTVGDGGGGGGGGGLAAAASATAQPAGAHPYVPPRRYQRMSPVDTSAPSEPLTRILAVIKVTEPKPQYTCKRCVV